MSVKYYTSAANYLKVICTVKGKAMLSFAVYICLCTCLYVSVVCILKDDHYTLQLRAHRHYSLYCKPT